MKLFTCQCVSKHSWGWMRLCGCVCVWGFEKWLRVMFVWIPFQFSLVDSLCRSGPGNDVSTRDISQRHRRTQSSSLPSLFLPTRSSTPSIFSHPNSNWHLSSTLSKSKSETWESISLVGSKGTFYFLFIYQYVCFIPTLIGKPLKSELLYFLCYRAHHL